jgi:hypothetical protein
MPGRPPITYVLVLNCSKFKPDIGLVYLNSIFMIIDLFGEIGVKVKKMGWLSKEIDGLVVSYLK